MTTIDLVTYINAPIEVCFNLSRSADLHMISTSKTNETVIAGRSTGLFEKGNRVTWRAKHFGIYQRLEMEISHMLFPVSFQDRMVKGIFKSVCHNHYFSSDHLITVMKDVFQYEVPFGFIGQVFNGLVLKKYLTQLLKQRNTVIKNYAESNKWKDVIKLA